MRSAITQSPNYKWWVFVAISMGTFVHVVDQISTSVALPTIRDHFHADLPTVQWVLVGYVLAISALLLPAGRLSDIVGRKQIYVSGCIIFVIGAALAGFSGNITSLILSKVLQGCGAAMAQGTGMAMITSVFPSHERGKALGLVISVVGSGSIVGPALAGFLIDALDWRWVLFFSAVIGTLAAIAPMVVLDKHRFASDSQRSRFDWLGATLSAASLIALLLAVTTGPRTTWASPFVIGSLFACVVLLSSFIWWELRTSTPMLDLRLFKRRLLSLGVLAAFISFLTSSSARFLMPFYLQSVRGYSPSQTGLILVPNAVAMVVMGPLGGRLSDRYGWRKFNVLGMVQTATGLFLLARVTETSPLGLAIGGMMLAQGGMAMFEPSNNSSILATVEQGRYGVISGLLHLARNAGDVMSIAVSTAIVTAMMASMGYAPSLDVVSGAGGGDVIHAFNSGLRTAYLIMGSIALVGAVMAFLKKGRTRETPTRQPEEAQLEEAPPD